MLTSTRRALLAAAASSAGVAAFPVCAADAPSADRVLPTSFEENLIYATPVTADGKVMKLLTDTGGGLFLFDTTVARLGLTDKVRKVAEGGQEFSLTPLPDFRPEASIPPPMNSMLPVLATEGEARVMAERGLDGMLGQAWFGNRIWTFDYPGRRLVLHHAPPAQSTGARSTPLYFQSREGRRSSHFPRIEAEIDGQVLDLLFDTGAQSPLTPEAIARVGAGPELRASSFIVKSVFDRWRTSHPDWPVVEKGEKGIGGDLIRVANVRVAGFDTGPAWFASRADKNFTEWMAQWMDKPLHGALGASALHPFRVVADYPGSKAWFEKP